MKKITLVFLTLLFSFSLLRSQTTLIAEAPIANATTQQRAPNGTAAAAYLQACSIVLQSELAIIPANTTITQFGFTLSAGAAAAVTGNFTVYLQNTTDVLYQKGTNWAGILTGMTSVYASFMTIPLTANSTSIIMTLSTPFVYTGGGLYVAYDWNSVGPFSATPATYLAEGTTLSTGSAAGFSTSAVSTLTNSAFRPTFLFAFTNPYTNDVKIVGVEGPGRIPAVLNAPINMRALIKNSSNTTISNIPVTMNVTGANAFSNTQTITSLAAGATSLVTFANYTPLQPGAQTVSVTVPSDQFTGNNMVTYPQNITCNIWGQNPASGTYVSQSVGFATGSGLLLTPMTMSVNASLSGVRGALSTNAPTVGNKLYGVLVSSGGVVMAMTNTITVTNGMLGTYISFTFSSPQPISAFTPYYIGFAQTANSVAYHPAGTQFSPYLPLQYYYTGINGGALTLLTANYGYFGLEAMFDHTVTISAASTSVNCGSPATLNAVSSTNYSWSTGATSSQLIVTPTITTNYTVSATNTLGCNASTTASVQVIPIPVLATATPSTSCSGALVTLNASGASSYTWTSASGTGNLSTYTDTPITSITYTLRGKDPNGCTAINVLSLVVNPLPIVNISNPTPSICAGKSVSVTASGNSATYLWDTGAPTASVTLSPTTTTAFTVTGTSAAGCTAEKTMTVLVNSFTPGITSPTAICAGQSISLTATGASTLMWSTNSIFAGITVTPAITSSYSVTGKGFNGCQGSNSTTVTVNQNPTVTAVATRTSLCRKESVTLTAGGALSYSWSTTQTVSVIVLTPTVANIFSYSVTGKNAEGCETTVSIDLKVNTCNSIDENNGLSLFALYPNPVSAELILSYPGISELIEVEIYNAAGQKVISLSTSAEKTALNMSAVAAGVYQVNVLQNGALLRTSRIVKQ